LVKRDGGVGGGDFVLGKDPTKDKKAVEIKHAGEDRMRGWIIEGSESGKEIHEFVVGR
jgi:hypothetical protein